MLILIFFQKLYVLATDQGFLKEVNFVWQVLSSLEDDGYFVDGKFEKSPTDSSALSGKIGGVDDNQGMRTLTDDELMARAQQEDAE